LNNLYLSTDSINSDAYSYGNIRQHNFSSLDSVLPQATTLLDKNSLNKFFEYTLDVQQKNNNFKIHSKILPYNSVTNLNKEDSAAITDNRVLNTNKILGNKIGIEDIFFTK
jgi:hypothetical protein